MSNFRINPTEAEPRDSENLLGNQNEHDVAKIVFSLVICILGLLGNLFALFIILFLKEYKKSVTHWYVLQLAIADSLFLLTLPFKISEDFNQGWVYHEWLCKAKETILFLNYYASILFLVIMSFDRYVAVCHPFSCTAQKMRKKTNAFIITVAVWAVSLMICIPVMLYSAKSGTEPNCLCSYEFPNPRNLTEECLRDGNVGKEAIDLCISYTRSREVSGDLHCKAATKYEFVGDNFTTGGDDYNWKNFVSGNSSNDTNTDDSLPGSIADTTGEDNSEGDDLSSFITGPASDDYNEDDDLTGYFPGLNNENDNLPSHIIFSTATDVPHNEQNNLYNDSLYPNLNLNNGTYYNDLDYIDIIRLSNTQLPDSDNSDAANNSKPEAAFTPPTKIHHLPAACHYWTHSTSWIAFLFFNFIVMFILPFAVLLGCYGLIIKRLIATRLEKTATRSDRERKRVTVMCAALVSCFLVCWLPFHAFHLAKVVGVNSQDGQFCASLTVAGTLLGFLNSAVNPYLYSFSVMNINKNWNALGRERSTALSTIGRRSSSGRD